MPDSASTFVIAAVSVVLPWSMWPIVPTLTCGFDRSNFCFPMLSSGLRLTNLTCESTMSLAMDWGTSSYRSNCIVNVARPWVIERRSVAYPNISDSGTLALIDCELPIGSRLSTRPRRLLRLPMTSPR